MQAFSRLIHTFAPKEYTLSLDLQREKRTFSGLVTIHGTAINDGSISVHAKDLDIKSATVDGKAAAFTAGNNDELIISHPDIFPGLHMVVIEFSGTITDSMHGMYPCYFDHDGTKKELLATQFESHHAREVFPCVDEPEAKATFSLTLTTEKNVTVLGNMPVKTQRTENDKQITMFETTPRMSTYLLAWVVGELHKKTAASKSGVEVTIWTTPAQKSESLDFALATATRTIDFFNDYFGVPYPLPKSDHVALPDFSAGAMENWGLITYREAALLVDPTITSITAKQYVALVIAHELSHQWFGNLVTMKWWNNLWLNESFANLMEYVALDAIYPEWNVWLDFSSYETISALRRDSIDGVQAVQVDVNHPDEIGTLFDGAIVYAKGARLLRMLQHYIGHQAFQAGLKAYFAQHAYKNTEADDLWNALSKASGKDVASLMSVWISQPGYPVVSINENQQKTIISQKQFFIGPHQPSSRIWPVPLDATDSAVPALLDTVSTTLTSTLPFRLNVADSAHFITNYAPSYLQAILDEMKLGKLAPLNRLQLLHEQSLLARGGEISTANLISLLSAYENETNEAVWGIIGIVISELKKFVEEDEASEKQLKSLAVKIAAKQYNRLGWSSVKDEDEFDTKLRAIIIGLMLYGEDEKALQTARELYASTPLETLDPELRSLIISAEVRHGSSPLTVPSLIDTYKITSSPNLKSDITAGLAATSSPEVISSLLEIIKDDSIVRPQDVFRWFMSIIHTKEGREPAWQWMQENWPWIKETFGGDKSYDYFPRYAGNKLSTRSQLEEYKTFFTPMLQEPSLTRVITLGISDIKGRVELLERDMAAVKKALAQL